MPPTAAPKFLCESCGHDLSATDPTAHCPECGMQVAGSHHWWRVGSPYQQNPSYLNAVITAAQFCARPRRLFRVIKLVEADAMNYFARMLLLTGVITSTPLFIVCAVFAIKGFAEDPFLEFLFGVIVFFTVLVGLFGLGVIVACICEVMIRLTILKAWSLAIGARSDNGLLSIVSWTASSAFLIAALGVPIGALAAYLMETRAPIIITPLIFTALAAALWLRGVHIGLLELRYANPPPIARDDAGTPPPPQVFTENISPPVR